MLQIDLEAVVSCEYIPPGQRVSNRSHLVAANHGVHQAYQQQLQQHPQHPRRSERAPDSSLSHSGAGKTSVSRASLSVPSATLFEPAAAPVCRRADRADRAKHMNRHAVAEGRGPTQRSRPYGATKPLKHSLNVTDKLSAKHSLNPSVIDKILGGDKNLTNNKPIVLTHPEKNVSVSNGGAKPEKYYKPHHPPSGPSYLPGVHKQTSSYLTPVNYPDSVSVSSSYASGVVGASASVGVFGLYSESKYAFSVNGLPGNPAQTSAAAAFFAR